MKKFYALMCAAALASQAQAQEMEKFEGAMFSMFSPNGDWLVENLQGSMQVKQRSTGDEFSSADETGMLMYNSGLGHCVTNSGAIVGIAGEYAGIWKNGEWTNLPQTSGIGTTYNTGHSITPDEHRICGVLGIDGATYDGNTSFAGPVVWTKNDAGEYELAWLPCPEKDFLGNAPQYTTAVVMSDDGKTIVGQVRDNSGFYMIPIVYKEAADGTWSYRMVGESMVYDKTKLGELPEMPVAPTYPDYTAYMSDEDQQNYQDAMTQYDEDVQRYYNGEITEFPEYPQYVDYMSDATQKEAYQAAVNKYNTDLAAYNADYQAYVEKREEIVTNMDFMQNALALTSDGRYLGVTLVDRNTDSSDVDDWGESSAKYTVGYFDLSKDDPEFVAVSEPGDFVISNILDDRTVLYATPSSEYTRSTYVVMPDSKESLPFGKYMEKRNATAAKWLADNNTYDVIVWGFDDEWNPIVESEVEDSLVVGSVNASADGNVFVSFYEDSFTDPNMSQFVSYVIDLNTATAIGGVAPEQKWATKPRYYNMQGQQLSGVPVNGMYIESKDGKSFKRMK